MSQLQKRIFPLLPLTLFGICILYLIHATAIRESVRAALSLCGCALVPSLFPILVFSRLLSGNRKREVGEGKRRGILKDLAFGWIFGFPAGAMLMSETVDASQDPQKAPLLYFSCGTGANFVISFVGLALLEDLPAGIALYLSQVFALLLLCLPSLYRSGGLSVRCADCQESRLSLFDAIRSAAFDTVAICGCVVFFGSVSDLLAVYLPEAAMHFLLPWIEVSGAASRLCRYSTLRSRLLLGFSVGFGGISAILQMLPFVKKAGGTASGLFRARCKSGALTALFFFLSSLCLPS